MMGRTILLIGTLDTKGEELRFVRDSIHARGHQVLLLDAGDEFQGSLWYYIHRGVAVVHFMNELQYDAMVSNTKHSENMLRAR